jgi:UDP-glucose 4-epimerase
MDIRNAGALGELYAREQFDVVSHQAARASVRVSMQEPVLYAEVNILGSLNLLQMCRQFGIRKFIYASTGGAVYGEPQYLPADENHPVNPLDPYGASKHHVEHYLYLYRAHFKIPYTILRYPNVYGPRQDPYGEAGVVAIFTGQMLRGEQPVINGDGLQERDFVYVGDVARANLLAVDKGDGEIVNLGSGRGTNVNTIFSKLRDITGYVGREVHGPAKLGEVSRIYLDASKARTVLGWEPTVGLDEGLRKTVEYFRTRN